MKRKEPTREKLYTSGSIVRVFVRLFVRSFKSAPSLSLLCTVVNQMIEVGVVVFEESIAFTYVTCPDVQLRSWGYIFMNELCRTIVQVCQITEPL